MRLSVLQPGEIQRIHEAALRILDRVGIVVRYPAARGLLESSGARVDGGTEVVRLPRHVIEHALRAAPRAFALYGRPGRGRDCMIGEGRWYGRPSTGLNWILDAGTCKRRPVGVADVVNWARLSQALPNIHLAASAFDQEGAANATEVRATAALLQHTDKPLLVSSVSGEGIRWISRLTDIAQAGGRHPRCVAFSSVNSPLTYSHGQAEAALVAAELGMPVLFNSTPVAGVTAPVTMAGLLAQMHAELLAALTVIQIWRPGTPVLYAGHPMMMDMRTGMPAHGFGEAGLATAAAVEMGRSCGLAVSSPGLMTDSCTPDAMAAVEKWATGYPPALAGAMLNGGGGGLACQATTSLEQLVIDDDTFGRIFRHLRGIRVDPEYLGEDVVERVGPGGSFLGEEHTLEHFQSEYDYSSLANRENAATWEQGGFREVRDRAADVVRQILGAPPRPVVSDEEAKALREVSERAERALADTELPT
jgi:trimethylamine--corrinoid protein Co-methyltransferase